MELALPEGHFLFTSESVNEGHPDKLSDQVSDAILDACIAADPKSRVACESCCKGNMVMIFGEITTSAQINYEQVVREAVRQIGYDSVEKGLDYKTFDFINKIETQSQEIAHAVIEEKTEETQGAGDQGIMFGYATNETKCMMPLTHDLATSLGHKLTEVRKNGTLSWLRPDGKTQVTVEYKQEGTKITPLRVNNIVISTQHEPGITNEEIRKQIIEYVIKPVVPTEFLDANTIYHINPSGSFTLGGPAADAGLTGRKIIIDTYGGWGAHGGGAFSGKDPSKVDRSAAYACRWIAKSLVAADLCDRALVQVGYAIGISKPLSIYVNSYGTVKNGKSDFDLCKIVSKNFDLRPGIIVRDLNLKRPIYKQLAAYGHMGREEIPDCLWEIPKDLSHEK